ncbi:MAG TPA: hypothetical protein VGN16_17945 [Acidobacteriaceae bacterium]|jgi:hypothetical protein
MSRRDVERLAVRAAIGDPVCAHVTRRDGELVMLEESGTSSFPILAGAVFSAAMATAMPMTAQSGNHLTADKAILNGRLLDERGVPLNGLSGMVILQRGEVSRMAVIRADGSFEIDVPPGAYDIKVSGVQPVIQNALLHEGFQSLGDVRVPPTVIATIEGEIAVTTTRSFWLRHPVAYARYVGRRIRNRLGG